MTTTIAITTTAAMHISKMPHHCNPELSSSTVGLVGVSGVGVGLLLLLLGALGSF